MVEDDFFIERRICIVGLGLMGGSLALALQGYCQAVIGVDPDLETLELALKQKAIQVATPNISEAITQADLIILAAPVRANLKLLEEIPRFCPGPLSILDLSSTKSEIVEAMNRLPKGFSALGGHPMCGKETSGYLHAEAKLFWDATFVLTKTHNSSPELINLAGKIIAIIGAKPFWLDPATHDRWAAATSHLPYLISSALMISTPREETSLIGPGFLSTSRLAASDVVMMMDILLTNREQVLRALSQYRKAIVQIDDLLQNSPDELRSLLLEARLKREKIVKRDT